MSAYNKRTQNFQQRSKRQSFSNTKVSNTPPPVPGTPLQQMWTVLNFHEQRLGQMSQYLQKMDEMNTTPKQQETNETEHMIQYNTLLQQVSELTDRVAKLEAEKTSNVVESISFSIEEDLQNASIGQPTV